MELRRVYHRFYICSGANVCDDGDCCHGKPHPLIAHPGKCREVRPCDRSRVGPTLVLCFPHEEHRVEIQ